MTCELAEMVQVLIPRRLYKEIEKIVRANSGEFTDVNKYIEFVLNEVVNQRDEKSIYTPDEEEKLKDKLRELGYM